MQIHKHGLSSFSLVESLIVLFSLKKDKIKEGDGLDTSALELQINQIL